MKTTSLRTLHSLILVLACIAVVACNGRKESADKKPPDSFGHPRFLEVTPMLDGSAYARSSDSLLWYLRSNKAVRVTALADASQTLPEFSEITAVMDGSAYAESRQKESGVWYSGLWYLRAEHAEKVTEVSSLADSGAHPIISDRAFYALYLSERKKRKDAEYQADNPAEFEERPDYP